MKKYIFSEKYFFIKIWQIFCALNSASIFFGSSFANIFLPKFAEIEVPVVEVDSWHMGVPGVDDGADPAGEEAHLLALGELLAPGVHLGHGGGGDEAVHHAHSDPSLVEKKLLINKTKYFRLRQYD